MNSIPEVLMSPSWKSGIFLDDNRRRDSVRNPWLALHLQQRLPKPLC